MGVARVREKQWFRGRRRTLDQTNAFIITRFVYVYVYVFFFLYRARGILPVRDGSWFLDHCVGCVVRVCVCVCVHVCTLASHCYSHVSTITRSTEMRDIGRGEREREREEKNPKNKYRNQNTYTYGLYERKRTHVRFGYTIGVHTRCRWSHAWSMYNVYPCICALERLRDMGTGTLQ